MKIIPVILLLVFSCAVCAQELKEKYAEADGFRQKYEAGYFGGNRPRENKNFRTVRPPLPGRTGTHPDSFPT